MVEGNETINCWNHGAKVQGHTMLKLELGAWQSHYSRPFRSNRFSSFLE